MKYPTKVSDALHCLAFIYLNPRDDLSSSAIAYSIKTHPSYTRQLMAALKKAGLLLSQRGQAKPRIARSIEKITLLDVYRAVEGNKPLLHLDTHTNPDCGVGINIQLVIQEYYQKVQQAAEKAMQEITLADIIQRYYQKIGGSMTLLPEIQAEYEKWRQFLYEKVTFSHKVSTIHTRSHCARVLLFALSIAQKMNLPAAEREKLGAAASFHDSRRHDDWLDVGHGQRAAEYYKEYCQENKLPFDEDVYDMMAWHDRDDSDGIAAIEKRTGKDSRAVLLYKIFKDADALDRFRLGPNGLDVKYLRTDAAKSLYDFAQSIDVKELGPGILTMDSAGH